ncbi:helix-turn-helix domain-containing protein (plasmid) [Exiguobacterium mexicanum]|uniref:helix-turn-helix domain-containing protein n=1 Tax=Exiguobacterium mexicanum TaxID=340146 RepID=UPI003AB1B79B
MIINEVELKRLIREAVREALEAHKSTSVEYLTVQEVTKRLGISRPFCDRLIREEGLPVIRIGAAIRINSSSLKKWLDNREGTSK